MCIEDNEENRKHDDQCQQELLNVPEKYEIMEETHYKSLEKELTKTPMLFNNPFKETQAVKNA